MRKYVTTSIIQPLSIWKFDKPNYTRVCEHSQVSAYRV